MIATANTIQPDDAQELAARLSDANRDGLAVIPRGGGTKLAWGNRPRRADLQLSTSRLDRIVEHAWADLTVTVEAGCRIGVLQEALRAHGQRIAIDPLWPERATVGGVLSTNDTAALRLRFGGLRDLIIGTTIALADGTLARSGGKVVKNVAGYDLSKLVTGAFGTLGVITTATFRLHPLPQRARTLSAPVAGLAEAQRLVLTLQDSKLAHTSLQVRVDDAGSAEVDVLLEGTPAGVDAQTRETMRVAGNVALAEHTPAVWQARQQLWAGGPQSIVKVSTLTAEIMNTATAARRLAGAAGGACRGVFQATGVAWLAFTGPASAWPDLVRELRRLVAPHGGSVVVLQTASTDSDDVPGLGDVDAWGDTGDAQGLMETVKREFDPKGTLNPGRFVGGI